MRINISLEVAPDEVSLATELLAVLRSITDHVSIKQTALSSTSSSPIPPAAPPGAPAVAPAPAPAPAVPAAAPAAALPAQQALSFPPGTTPTQMYEAILLAAEHDPHLDPFARQLEAIFLTKALGEPLDLVREFAAVWKRIALDPSLPAQARSAYPFVSLLAHTNKDLQTKLRDMIVTDILKHLTAKRAVDVPRDEFFIQAEAFAALVSLEIVALEGAVQTMAVAMMRKPENRAAAVTMLGKTVDLAGHLLLEKCSEKTLGLMREQVLALQEKDFQYDKAFILESMGWSVPQPAAAAEGATAAPATPAPAANGPAPAGPAQLRPIQSCRGHSEMVFGLAVDGRHRQLVSGGKDNFLQVWTEDGKHVQRLELGDKYVSTMDFHSRLGLLLCTGLTTPGNTPTFLAAFQATDPNGFRPQGFIQRAPGTQVTCVRALPETSGFVSGETVPNPAGASQDILYWDVAAGGSFSALQPVKVFRGHSDIVTTLSRFPADPNAFVSGSKDATVALWDVRAGAAAAQFGVHAADGVRRAHDSMVTCLDAAGHLVFSGSTDRTVKVWDSRRISQAGSPPLAALSAGGQVVLKIAANPARGTAVVSGMQALFFLDYANEAAIALRQAEYAWPDGRKPLSYHDIKWSEGGAVLYAAGKEALVDMYALA